MFQFGRDGVDNSLAVSAGNYRQDALRTLNTDALSPAGGKALSYHILG